MRYSGRYLGLIGLVLVTGCNKAPSPGTSGDAVQFQSGQWAMTTEVMAMDVPGVPANVKDRMLSLAKSTGNTTRNFCLTPEQAKKPSSEMFAGKQQGCTYSRYSMSAGRMDVAVTCKPPQANGMAVAMTMSGPMTPTGFELSMDQNVTGAKLPGGTMTMKARMAGKRIGDCKA